MNQHNLVDRLPHFRQNAKNTSLTNADRHGRMRNRPKNGCDLLEINSKIETQKPNRLGFSTYYLFPYDLTLKLGSFTQRDKFQK